MATQKERLRLDSIDVLRGIAALSVAFYHIWGHDGGYAFSSIGIVPQTPNPSLYDYIISPLRWGYLGVSLFLVLSGFCIHLPYARKRYRSGEYQFAARPFFVRRIWRLYPAYILAILGTSALLLSAHSVPSFDPGNRLPLPTASDILSHLTMAHGFIEAHFYSIISVFWSLSLEFQLYILYPLFLLLFRKFGAGRSVIMLTILSLIWRYVALNVWGYGLISISAIGPFTLMGCALARMPEWLFGALAAELFARSYEGKPEKILSAPKNIFSSSAIFLFASAVLTTLVPLLYVLTDILFGLSFAALVMRVIAPDLLSKEERKHVLLFRWLVRIGIISYSLYLFHLPLAWILEAFLRPEPGNVGFTLIRFGWLLVSLVPIYVLFRITEQPFMKPPLEGERWSRFYLRLAGSGK